MDPFKEKRNISAVSHKTKVFIISQALAEKQLRLSGVNFFTSDGILGSTGKQLEKFLNTFNQTVFPPNDIILKNGSVINQGDLNKTSVYNTEITQCFPGKEAKGDRKPDTSEIKNCLDKNFLFNEIKINRKLERELLSKENYILLSKHINCGHYSGFYNLFFKLNLSLKHRIRIIVKLIYRFLSGNKSPKIQKNN